MTVADDEFDWAFFERQFNGLQATPVGDFIYNDRTFATALRTRTGWQMDGEEFPHNFFDGLDGWRPRTP